MRCAALFLVLLLLILILILVRDSPGATNCDLQEAERRRLEGHGAQRPSA